MSDWQRLRDLDNLRRAWQWIRSNPDASYKSYFRDLYRNYAAAEDVLLADLADRLRRGVYAPTVSCKLFFPKASGVLRPYSLLTVEDQIVYQAVANLIAERLLPRVRRQYYKQVFGHLYAGKNSPWFYRKWSDGYRQFNQAARKAFADGFIFTASFDLTAYYDSLDHAVLRHFLNKLGFQPDFCKQITDWFEKWTATEREIYHNHGIPQGPLPSGLISEVVLSHFDSLKLRGVTFRYFRYVDDIRLFAKTKRDLRRLLVELDLLSKDVGLFPQGAKIGIHEVIDIEDELKSVSSPSEIAVPTRWTDQAKLLKRIVKLTPRYKVKDQTRFKYLLAHATPRAVLTSRLWKILDNHPELYKSICNYLRRYRRLPKKAASKAVSIIRKSPLYHSVRAEFISAVDGRLPPAEDKALASVLLKLWAPRSHHPDLLARSATFLIRTGTLTAGQIAHICVRARFWWTRATLVNAISLNHIGQTTWHSVIDDAITDKCDDVGLAAAWNAFTQGYRPRGRAKRWNRPAALMLRELGLIQRNTAAFCGVNNSMQKLSMKIPAANWKRLFVTHYDQAERQAVEVAALSGTNITAFVNALDVFNDLLLSSVFEADGTIGSYTLGNIGSSLNAASRFAAKYPRTFALAKEVHEARYESMYSHPLVRRTQKPTKKTGYSFLSKARRMIALAVDELRNSGLL